MAEDKKIIATVTYGLDELDTVVQQLQDILTDCQIITFTGPLGAGKTTLIRALLATFGITDVTSPTFAYLQIYTNEDKQQFYHFDLYRIDSIDAFINMGFDEYLHDPDAKICIEWPTVIMPLLTGTCCHITIDYHGIDKRTLTIEKDAHC